MAALQHLPGNQRAALLLFEVLGFSAAEIAEHDAHLDGSVNSALQRARRLVAERVPARSQQQTLRELDDARLRELVDGFAAALERGDAEALIALLTEDVTWSMPPLAQLVPRAARGHRLRPGGAADQLRRLAARPTSANGQPAVACYLRGTDDDRATGPGRSTC